MNMLHQDLSGYSELTYKHTSMRTFVLLNLYITTTVKARTPTELAYLSMLSILEILCTAEYLKNK